MDPLTDDRDLDRSKSRIEYESVETQRETLHMGLGLEWVPSSY